MILKKSTILFRTFIILFFIIFASQPTQSNSSKCILSPTFTIIITLILFCIMITTHFIIIQRSVSMNRNFGKNNIYYTIHVLLTVFTIIFSLVFFIEQNIISGWAGGLIIVSIIILLLLSLSATHNIVQSIRFSLYAQAIGLVVIYLYLLLLSSTNIIYSAILHLLYENVVSTDAIVYSPYSLANHTFILCTTWIILLITIYSCIHSIYIYYHNNIAN